MSKHQSRGLKNVKVAYWIYLTAFVLIAHFFVGYIPAIHPDQRTLFVDQANPSATLSNNRWNNKDFWFAWTTVFLWAVSFSGALMLAWWDVTWLQVLHIIITVFVLILFIAMVVFNVIDCTNANKPPSATISWIKNNAHDPRYCCIYGAADTTCPNNPSGGACPVVPAVEDLTLNGDFFVGFVFRIIYTIFLIVALIIACVFIRYAWRDMRNKLRDTKLQVIVVTEDPLEPVQSKIKSMKSFKGM
jgi:hypothetical protein